MSSRSVFNAESGAARPASGLEREPSRWLAQDAFATRAVIALGVVVFFFHLGSYGLWEPDEARYAEIGREMLALGNFIVPHLNYVPYIEKPPLLYWLTALCFKMFGLNELAARLVPALSGLGTVTATFFFVRRTFDRRRAMLAAAILTTAPIFAVMAQVLTTDMLLTALTTVALYALFIHYLDGGWWCWIAYFAMAAATLTKGPVGIALPVASMAVFLWWEGELRGAIRRFHALAGFLVMVAIVAPWFVAISLKEPGFVDFYFVGEYLKRALVPSYSHEEPFYYYGPVIVGGLLPWSVLVPFLTWRRMSPNPARRYCFAASATIIGLFSLASAKLIPYVLPAFPPLAVLIADGVASCAWPDEELSGRPGAPDSRILKEVGPLISLTGVGAILVAILAPMFRSPYPMAVRPALYGIGAVAVAGGAAMTFAFLMRKPGAGLTLLVLTLAGALLVGSWARLEAEPLRSYAQLSREVARRAPDATLICYRRYVQSLPFYTHRRVILVGPETELTYGAHHSKDAAGYFLKTDAQMLRLWSQPRPTVLVIDASDLARLKPKLGAFTVIGSEHTKRAVLNRDERLAGN